MVIGYERVSADAANSSARFACSASVLFCCKYRSQAAFTSDGGRAGRDEVLLSQWPEKCDTGGQAAPWLAAF